MSRLPRQSAARILCCSLALLAHCALLAPLALLSLPLLLAESLGAPRGAFESLWSALRALSRQRLRRFEQSIGALGYERCDWRRRRELAGAQPPGFFQPRALRLADRLAQAAYAGDLPAARRALARGADPLFPLDGSGYATPLAIASARCESRLSHRLPVALLLMEARGAQGACLEIATRLKRLELVEAALRLGADPNALALTAGNPFIEPAPGASSLFERLMDGPASQRRPELFELPEPADPPSPLHVLCAPGSAWRRSLDDAQAPIARALIAAGARVNHANRAGQSALTLCAAHGQFPLACALLELGADPLARDAQGRDLSWALRQRGDAPGSPADLAARAFEARLRACQERQELALELEAQPAYEARRASSRL